MDFMKAKTQKEYPETQKKVQMDFRNLWVKAFLTHYRSILFPLNGLLDKNILLTLISFEFSSPNLAILGLSQEESTLNACFEDISNAETKRWNPTLVAISVLSVLQGKTIPSYWHFQ